MKIRLRNKNSYVNIYLRENLENVFYCADYYRTLGARELCHRFKENDHDAIISIGTKMSNFITSDDSIIPVPSRSGKATNTLKLAEVISEITGAKVYDIIEGKSRPSIYYAKKRGDNLSLIDFGFKLKDNIPKNPVIIDAVLDTGTTIKAIQSLIPNSKIVVYARTTK